MDQAERRSLMDKTSFTTWKPLIALADPPNTPGTLSHVNVQRTGQHPLSDGCRVVHHFDKLSDDLVKIGSLKIPRQVTGTKVLGYYPLARQEGVGR